MKFRLKNSFYFHEFSKISSIKNFNFYKMLRIFIDHQYGYQSLQLDSNQVYNASNIFLIFFRENQLIFIISDVATYRVFELPEEY